MKSPIKLEINLFFNTPHRNIFWIIAELACCCYKELVTGTVWVVYLEENITWDVQTLVCMGKLCEDPCFLLVVVVYLESRLTVRGFCICKKGRYRKLLYIFCSLYQKMKLMECLMVWIWHIFSIVTLMKMETVCKVKPRCLFQMWSSDLEKLSVVTSPYSQNEYPLMPGGCDNCQAIFLF